MKGGTPDILYDLCPGLDKLYSEPIVGLPEPGQDVQWADWRSALFMSRWNVFHEPVHSACFIMDKAFFRMVIGH